MVLRGQPVGEQGAADRWTALDPYVAGSGAGAPRGTPSAAPPFSFPISFSRGPSGALFHAAGHLLNASPVDLLGLRNPWECRVTIVSSFNTLAFVSF